MDDERVMGTGELRRVLREEIPNALDDAAMKLEALRVEGMMRDLRELTARLSAYQAVIDQVMGLLEKARPLVKAALAERPSDETLATLDLLFERVTATVEALRAI